MSLEHIILDSLPAKIRNPFVITVENFPSAIEGQSVVSVSIGDIISANTFISLYYFKDIIIKNKIVNKN